MSQSKARRGFPLIPLQAHFAPDESMLVLSNAGGAIVAALKVPELRARLARSKGRRHRSPK